MCVHVNDVLSKVYARKESIKDELVLSIETENKYKIKDEVIFACTPNKIEILNDIQWWATYKIYTSSKSYW